MAALIFDFESLRLARIEERLAKPIRDAVQQNILWTFSGGLILCPNSCGDHRIEFSVKRKIDRWVEAQFYCQTCGIGGEERFDAPPPKEDVKNAR